MKRILLFLFILSCGAVASQAQDDVYFVPSKATKKAEKEAAFKSSYSNVFAEGEDNWAAGRGDGGWDVDAYNRRGEQRDTLSADTAAYYAEEGEDLAEYSTTARLVRFHSPTVGVVVSSPYYWDYYTNVYWSDPWAYDYYWGWRGFGWRYSPYYAGFWWGGWYDPWYDPWRPGWGWGPSWGWRPPHHHHVAALPSNVRRGPHGGYVVYGNRGTASGTSVGSNNWRRMPATRYGTGSDNRVTRPTSSRMLRNVERTNNGVNLQPSRPSTDRPVRNVTPSRSFGTPSGNSVRSSSGSRPTRTVSAPVRSGGGRSFGGRR